MVDKFFVVDPSVALKWYIPEDFSNLAIMFLKKLEDPDVKFYAPTLFKLEFSNAIRKYLIRKLISWDMAREILEEVKRLPITYVEITWERVERAFLYAVKRNLTLYDALYIIIAEEVGGKLITADKRLLKATADEELVVPLTNIKSNL